MQDAPESKMKSTNWGGAASSGQQLAVWPSSLQAQQMMSVVARKAVDSGSSDVGDKFTGALSAAGL